MPIDCFKQILKSKLGTAADRAAVTNTVREYAEKQRGTGDVREARDLHLEGAQQFLKDNLERRKFIAQSAGIDISEGPKGGEPNATQEGQQPENDQQQHQAGDQGGPTTPTGSSDSTVQGGQVEPGSLNQEPETFPTAPTEVPPPTGVEPGATGIAQRVHDTRAESGAIGTIEPGEGVSAEEMVNRGRQLVADGADPQAVSARIKETKQVSSDDVAVLRARMEELSKATNAAADELGKDPQNPALKQAYEDAFKAETDWAQNDVKPAQTEWHKAGMAMQGEVSIDTGTFTGLRRAFRDLKGRDATPEEQGKLQKLAEKNQGVDAEVAKAKDAYDKAIETETSKAPKGKRLPTDVDSLRNYFAEKLKSMLPCEI